MSIKKLNPPQQPSAHDYSKFTSELKVGLEKLRIKGLSLMLYGSISSKAIVPGWSDIDGLLVFPGKYIINKASLLECGKVLGRLKIKYKVPTEIAISDLATMRQGLLSPLDATFKNYVPNKFKLILGPDYRNSFSYFLEQFPNQNRLSWNLKKMRENLMLSDYYFSINYYQFFDNFKKAILWSSKLPLKIIMMVDKEEPTNWKVGIEDFGKKYPGFSRETLDNVTKIRSNNLDYLYNEYWGKDKYKKVMRFWIELTDNYENIVKICMEKIEPKPRDL